MRDLKRKLFPAPTSITALCPENSLISATGSSRSCRPDHRYQKRTARYRTTPSSTLNIPAGCDSLLATALIIDKSGNIPVKTQRSKRQQKDENIVRNTKSGSIHNYNAHRKNNLRDHSILMNLDGKENIKDQNLDKHRREVKHKQHHSKGNLIETAATIHMKNQKLPPKPLTNTERKSIRNSHQKQNKQNKRTIRNARNNHSVNFIQNGDSLAICTTERLLTKGMRKSSVSCVLSRTGRKEVAKYVNMKKKQRTRQNKRTNLRRIKNSEKINSILIKKPKKETKISTGRETVENVGLGAFVGITSKTQATANSTRDLSIKGFVSSLENDSSKTPALLVEHRTLDKIRPMMILTIPQESEPKLSLVSPKTENLVDRQIDHDNQLAVIPKEANRSQKQPTTSLSIGTNIQKNSLKGEIISKKFEESDYSVRYEDQDEIELKENALNQANLTSRKLDFQRRINLKCTNHTPRNELIINKVLKKQNTKDRKCANDDEELTKRNPVRRSRRRSTPPKRFLAFDSTHKGSEYDICVDTTQTHKSRRRSKRRSSQPLRLIDCAYIKVDDQTIKKREKKKRISVKRETKSKRNNSSRKKAKNRTINRSLNKIAKNEGKKSATSRKKRGVTSSDQSATVSCESTSKSSQLKLPQECPRKQEFDDALKAMMPEENFIYHSANGPSNSEDDIFDATPMRKLFIKNDSNDPSKNKNPLKGNTKNSKSRNFNNTHVSTTKSKDSETIKSSLKKRKTNNSNDRSLVRKRVRISDESNKVKGCIDNCIIPNDNDQWTLANLKELRTANRTVDPKSFSFWEEVSEIVSNKSAVECREKWFSLVNTPVIKRRQKSKNNDGLKETLVASSTGTSTLQNLDDDIFNATPLRGIFDVSENIDNCHSTFGEIDDLFNLTVGSAIKIDQVECNSPSAHVSQKKKGYKTYIQNMGRNMRQEDKRKKLKEKENSDLTCGKNLAECVDEGDVEVKCKLSPGGTLKVDTYGDTDTEDYLVDDSDE